MNETKEIQNNTYLTFHLDEELYGLNIHLVREVLEYTPITKVPMTADFMRGVINVRGHVVPVVDLRLKFGLEPAEQTVNTCIIIVELMIEGEPATMGALVDGVQEVLDITPEQIEDPPRLGSKINTRYLQGIAKLPEQFVILLDIQAIFSTEELSMLAEIHQERMETAESKDE
ncbi:MAG: chemotaxis protein CheW [Desulfosudaceae bacterium]